MDQFEGARETSLLFIKEKLGASAVTACGLGAHFCHIGP